jgi:hypothetical protein
MVDGWKLARLFSRLQTRVFRPAMAMFTSNDAAPGQLSTSRTELCGRPQSIQWRVSGPDKLAVCATAPAWINRNERVLTDEAIPGNI